jgi:protein-disulfide isomerase
MPSSVERTYVDDMPPAKTTTPPTRKQRRAQARAERLERERAAAARARRLRSLTRLAAVAAAAIAIVLALVVVSREGASETAAPSAGDAPAGAADSLRLFEGIPQRGTALGDPDAPVTMVEFADLQCPFCGQYSRDALPTIVERYVRTGKVRLELRVLRFIGPDSERAAQVALAAAGQDRLWQFVDLFYRNQGTENSGYVTEDFLRQLASATPGLDVERAIAEAGSMAVEDRLEGAESAAESVGIDATPSFLVGRTGGSLEPLAPSALEPGAFTGRLDELLRSR